MIYATWYGGASYAQSEVPADVESFRSLSHAQDALLERRKYGYGLRQHFEFVNRPAESDLCPCVDESSELWVYFADPSESHDPYPDRIIKFGPRGGIRVERA